MRRFLSLTLSLGLVCAWGSAALAGDSVRDAIKKLQKAKRAEERQDAARFLGGRADAEAVDALAQALSDRDPSVREAAASALWKTGSEAKAAEPALRKALEDPEPRVIASAAGALDFMDAATPEELAPARRRALQGARDDYTAFAAARGLIGLDPPRSVLPRLLRYLAREVEAMEAMSRPGGRSDVEAAEKALRRVAETTDRSAIPLLQDELGRSPASAPWLLKTLALFEPPPERFAQTLVREMRARSAKTRAAALSACLDLSGDADVAVWAPEATALLLDAEYGVRAEAVSALQEAGGRAAAAAPNLVRLLKEEAAPPARARVAQALGDIGDASQAVPQKTKATVAEQVKDAMVAAVGDKDEDVAGNALSSYNRLLLPAAEVVDVLARAAEGTGPVQVRWRALQMLRNRQGQAKPVLERVRALTKSPEKRVAEDARTAVEWIERGGPGSPNPLAAASSQRPAPSSRATAAAAVAPARHDPDAEARGLAKLRELKLPFDEFSFARALGEAQPEAVPAFIDAGVSPGHSFASDSGRSPLILLVFSGQNCSAGQPTPEPTREVVKALIAAGADLNQTDENGNTALMFAASKCDRATVRLLISAGAKIGLRNKMNFTALEGSIVSGNPGVEELIAAGARLDRQTAKDYLAAYKNNPKALALVKKATPQ
jgi:HEAT repeat protein